MRLSRYSARTLDLAIEQNYPPLDHELSRALVLVLVIPSKINRALVRALDLALNHALYYPELKNDLQQLRAVLPTNPASFKEWLQANGKQWTEQLRQLMIQHRSIGHDWQFTDEQQQQLQQYYDANKFLVELINIKGAVNPEVRSEIKDPLLVPWEKLQQSKEDH